MLEYIGGGDLLNLLIERDSFEENCTRLYVAEVRGDHSAKTLHPRIAVFSLLDDPYH